MRATNKTNFRLLYIMTIMPDLSIYKSLPYLEMSGQFYFQKSKLFKKHAVMTPIQLFTNSC